MKRHHATKLTLLAIACTALVACDDTIGLVRPAPADAGVDAPALASPETFGRGEYLAKNVAACGECHTPRDDSGNLDMSRWLSGVVGRFDLAPYDDAVGLVSAPNLTSHATGLASWTDDEILRAMRDGVGRDGAPLAPVMPYYVFHNMTDDDARAIVVYLRSVAPVENQVPARQPLPVPMSAPASPIPESAIPHTTLATTDGLYSRAEHGRYLAGQVGFCMDCHSPWRYDASPPLDVTKLFAGGRALSSREWVVPPPAPAVVYAYNVTPHDSGIKGWTEATVARAITAGLDQNGAPLCRPMPSGPFGSLGGITADDALDIGVYLTTLPPKDSGSIPQCPR
jgi:mono/diheme cytochrome c family protein